MHETNFHYFGYNLVQVTGRLYAKYKPTFMKESANVMGDFISWNRNK